MNDQVQFIIDSMLPCGSKKLESFQSTKVTIVKRKLKSCESIYQVIQVLERHRRFVSESFGFSDAIFSAGVEELKGLQTFFYWVGKYLLENGWDFELGGDSGFYIVTLNVENVSWDVFVSINEKSILCRIALESTLPNELPIRSKDVMTKLLASIDDDMEISVNHDFKVGIDLKLNDVILAQKTFVRIFEAYMFVAENYAKTLFYVVNEGACLSNSSAVYCGSRKFNLNNCGYEPKNVID